MSYSSLYELQSCFSYFDERGEVWRFIDIDQKKSNLFGEVYFTTVVSGHVKGVKCNLDFPLWLQTIEGCALFKFWRSSPQAKPADACLRLDSQKKYLLKINTDVYYTFEANDSRRAVIVCMRETPNRSKIQLDQQKINKNTA